MRDFLFVGYDDFGATVMICGGKVCGGRQTGEAGQKEEGRRTERRWSSRDTFHDRWEGRVERVDVVERDWDGIVVWSVGWRRLRGGDGRGEGGEG